MASADTLSFSLFGSDAVIGAEDMPLLCGQLKKEPEPAVEAVMAEVVLLNGTFAATIANYALKKYGIPQPESRLQAAIKIVQQAQKAAGNRPYDIALRDWKWPWIPLLMAWSYNVTPARTNNEADDYFAAFALGDIDLEFQGSSMQGQRMVFNGQTLLSPHGVQNLANTLNRLLEQAQPDTLLGIRQLAQNLKTANILSQQSDGLHHCFQITSFVPMLPIISLDRNEDELVKGLSRHIRSSYSVPLTSGGINEFLPVRAGAFELGRLRLIDAFGQFREVDVENQEVQIAQDLQWGKKGAALFRPRFLQPTRVDFMWILHNIKNDVGVYSAYDVSSTPLFGFVVPNFLDKSLLVHDQDGLLQGIVQANQTGGIWRAPPGNTPGVEQIDSLHLLLFVQGLLGEGNTALTQLLRRLDTAYQYIMPVRQEHFLQFCFGNVLALCRASVNLQGKGEPIYAQTTDTEDTDLAYDEQQVCLRLGDLRQAQNGLIGFYQGGCEEQTYSRLYACATDDRTDAGDDYIHNGSDVSLSLAGKAAALTLLLDPFGSISLRTGFLPAQAVILPPVFFKNSMENIQMMFQAVPVLSDRNAMALPLPGGLADTWVFSWLDEVGQQHQSVVKEADVQLPISRRQAMEGFLVAKKEEDGETR